MGSFGRYLARTAHDHEGRSSASRQQPHQPRESRAGPGTGMLVDQDPRYLSSDAAWLRAIKRCRLAWCRGGPPLERESALPSLWHRPYQGIRRGCPSHAAGATWLGHPRRIRGAGPRRRAGVAGHGSLQETQEHHGPRPEARAGKRPVRGAPASTRCAVQAVWRRGARRGGYARTGRTYSRRMLLPRREMSAP